MSKFGKGFIVALVILGGVGYIASSIQAEEIKTVYTTLANGRPIFEAPSTGQKGRRVQTETLHLNKNNMVIIRDAISALTAATAEQELLARNRELKAGAPIYLVLDTPGGDVDAGSQIADLAQGLNRPVHTITIFAASMGFNLVQRLGTRYVFPSGRLMAHRATIGSLGGQIPGEFLTRAAMVYNDVTMLERQNASRMGISFEQYTALVLNEYWVKGEVAVLENAADRVAYVTCDKSLEGSHVQTMNTLFGPVNVTWSNCPNVPTPLKIEAGANDKLTISIQEYFGSYQKFRSILKQ